jgi:hypothetical protein
VNSWAAPAKTVELSTFREYTTVKLNTSGIFCQRRLTFMIRACLLALLFGVWGAQSAYAGLTVTPTSWNVVGLDSNNQNAGPDTFQVGARVCNTGGTAVSNITGNFIWDTSNVFINLNGASTVNVSSLAAGACIDFYYPVTVNHPPLPHHGERDGLCDNQHAHPARDLR